MSLEPNSSSVYRARIGRKVFDVPMEWRVENGNGALTCVVYDEVTATRIAAALNLAVQVAADADSAALTDVIARFKQASA